VTPLFTKLNLGPHREIVVIGAPASFEPELAALANVTIRRDAKKVKQVGFAIAFVQSLAEASATWLPKGTGDAVVWFAYPKGTSERFKCEFNRDTGWAAVPATGFDAVRQVAIDEDWSALRFRRVEFIGRK
jgi:hypothetical protein